MSKWSDKAMDVARQAAPSSGATDAERDTAAHILAELIANHGLEIVDPKDGRRPSAPGPAPAPTYPRPAPRYYDAEVEEAFRQVQYTQPQPASYQSHVQYTRPQPIPEEPFYRGRAISVQPCVHCGRSVAIGEQVQRRVKRGVLEYAHEACGA